MENKFSFKLTKVAGVICSSMLIFGALTATVQARDITVTSGSFAESALLDTIAAISTATSTAASEALADRAIASTATLTATSTATSVAASEALADRAIASTATSTATSVAAAEALADRATASTATSTATSVAAAEALADRATASTATSTATSVAASEALADRATASTATSTAQADVDALNSDLATGTVNAKTVNTGDGGLNVNGGKTTISGTGDIATAGTISATGIISTAGGINVNGGNAVVSANGNITTKGTLSTEGNVSVNGKTTIASADGSINVNGQASINGSTGDITTAGDLSVGGGLKITGNGLEATSENGITTKSQDGKSVSTIKNTGITQLVTNSAGNTHGLTIGNTATSLSGGTNSTTLLLNDDGASFSNSAGNPVKVTGVADGSQAFDAVNFRQLDKVSKGVSMSMAMDAVPQASNGKGVIGLGVARFNNHNALAIGGSYHDDENGLIYNIKAAQSGEGKEKVNAGSLGIGWTF